MCRWITLISAESISLSDVVLAPSNSLVHQSRDATFHPGYDNFNNASMNGDGFGVGWYHTNVAICPTGEVASHDGSRDWRSSPISTVTTLTTTTTTTSNHNKQRVQIQTNGTSSAEDHSDDDDHNNELSDSPPTFAAMFKDIYPAWNNMNLREICLSTRSNCIMAHVRAASKGTGISYQNCHPFKAGRLLFCHNGRIDQFAKHRRRFLNKFVNDEAYANIFGTTDSECVFALVLTNLSKDEYAKESPLTQTKPFGAKRLVAALKKALHQIEHFLRESNNGVDSIEGYSTCNYSLTDGETMVVTRYCDKSPHVPPPSLYFAFGDAASLYHELTHEQSSPLFKQQQSNQSSVSSDDLQSKDNTSEETASVTSDSSSSFEEHTVVLDEHESRPGTILVDVNPKTASFIVSSNPLTKTHTWHALPRNCMMWCTRGSHPELRLLSRRNGRHASIIPVDY